MLQGSKTITCQRVAEVFAAWSDHRPVCKGEQDSRRAANKAVWLRQCLWIYRLYADRGKFTSVNYGWGPLLQHSTYSIPVFLCFIIPGAPFTIWLMEMQLIHLLSACANNVLPLCHITMQELLLWFILISTVRLYTNICFWIIQDLLNLPFNLMCFSSVFTFVFMLQWKRVDPIYRDPLGLLHLPTSPSSMRVTPSVCGSSQPAIPTR